MTTRKKPNIRSTTKELRTLMKEAEELLSDDHNGNVSEQSAQIGARIDDLLSSSRERVDQAKVVAQEKLHEADGYVRSHPYQAVGIAAGIGALVGVLASSRRAA